jgi:hypothetical protein
VRVAQRHARALQDGLLWENAIAKLYVETTFWIRRNNANTTAPCLAVAIKIARAREGITRLIAPSTLAFLVSLSHISILPGTYYIITVLYNLSYYYQSVEIPSKSMKNNVKKMQRTRNFAINRARATKARQLRILRQAFASSLATLYLTLPNKTWMKVPHP